MNNKISAFDTQFKNYIIEKVGNCGDFWEILMSSGWSFALEKSQNTYKPKVGDKIRLYGKGAGFSIRGAVIEGNVFFYMTHTEQEQKHADDIAKHNLERQEAFEKNKSTIDAKFEALPDIFKKRILKFRNANPEFRVKYEAYEMFCCEEAIKIAKALKTPDAIIEWNKLSFEEQRKIVDIDDGHSNNTFGCARTLAYMYVSPNPEHVVDVHGGMAILVGCEEYGCHKKPQKEEKNTERKLMYRW